MYVINSLTDDQRARFPEFVQRWTAIGLETAPARRREAEDAIARLYKYKSLAPPILFVWCGSPLSQGLTRAIIQSLPKKELGASVGDSVRASVRASVWASVRDSVRDSVWASVRASVRDSVRDGVGDSVGDSVRDSVRASVRASGYGAHDAGWLSFFSFFRDVTGLEKQTDPLAPLLDLAQCAGWWLPHAKICWVSERHSTLKRDERGRLHCADGAAVEYPDGWQIHAWHGLRVPKRIIEQPETITAKEILTEQNVEIRRAMTERVGYERFLREAGAKVIDNAVQRVPPGSWDDYDGKPVINELLAIDLPGDPEGVLKAVKCVCPTTGRVYVERVPPDVTTLLEAQAWQFNVKPEEYRIIAES